MWKVKNTDISAHVAGKTRNLSAAIEKEDLEKVVSSINIFPAFRFLEGVAMEFLSSSLASIGYNKPWDNKFFQIWKFFFYF